jgi:hypothetical protein
MEAETCTLHAPGSAPSTSARPAEASTAAPLGSVRPPSPRRPSHLDILPGQVGQVLDEFFQ